MTYTHTYTYTHTHTHTHMGCYNRLHALHLIVTISIHNRYTQAVKTDPRPIVLSYSPGGDNTPADGQWVATNQLGSMYRMTTVCV